MSPVDIDKHFDMRAPHYDRALTAFIGERELRQIRPFVPAGSNVLDYGCGTGRTTLDLLRRGCTVTAFDISREMLLIAERKSAGMKPAADQVVFITEQSELAGRTWPFITCIGVLDYYPDPQPLLKLLKSHLAPGGRLVITHPNALSPLGWLYALGSRFTVAVTPRTASFALLACSRAGFTVVALRYAFPAVRGLGLTLVLALELGLDAAA